MKRIEPGEMYRGMPCSVVSVGIARGCTDYREILALIAPGTHKDGYLSLKNMDALILANLEVDCKVYYKRGQRMKLREFARANAGKKAIICLLGHFVYFDGRDYYSFFSNGGDEVVQAWYLEDKE